MENNLDFFAVILIDRLYVFFFRFGAGSNDNPEFREKMNEIKQKKAAEKVLRDQILAQIADDRAERAALVQTQLTVSVIVINIMNNTLSMKKFF